MISRAHVLGCFAATAVACVVLVAAVWGSVGSSTADMAVNLSRDASPRGGGDHSPRAVETAKRSPSSHGFSYFKAIRSPRSVRFGRKSQQWAKALEKYGDFTSFLPLDVFANFDADGDGEWTVDDTEAAHSGILSRRESEVLVELTDWDDDGLVDYDEYMGGTQSMEFLFSRIIYNFDVDGSFGLNVEEFHAYLVARATLSGNRAPSLEEVATLVKFSDYSCEGDLDILEIGEALAAIAFYLPTSPSTWMPSSWMAAPPVPLSGDARPPISSSPGAAPPSMPAFPAFPSEPFDYDPCALALSPPAFTYPPFPPASDLPPPPPGFAGAVPPSPPMPPGFADDGQPPEMYDIDLDGLIMFDEMDTMAKIISEMAASDETTLTLLNHLMFCIADEDGDGAINYSQMQQLLMFDPNSYDKAPDEMQACFDALSKQDQMSLVKVVPRGYFEVGSTSASPAREIKWGSGLGSDV